MSVTVCAEVVAVALQLADQRFEFRVAIKITGQEERRFYALCFKCPANVPATLSKKVAGEDDGDLRSCFIAPNDRPVAFGQGFFFAASFCMAAVR